MKEKRDKNGGKGRGCEPRIEVIVQNAKTNKTSGRSGGGSGRGGLVGGREPRMEVIVTVHKMSGEGEGVTVDVNQELKLL